MPFQLPEEAIRELKAFYHFIMRCKSHACLVAQLYQDKKEHNGAG
jgi:hypothetical protein